MIEPVEVVQLPPGLRVFSVSVSGLCAGFFYWLAWSQPTRDHWIGYVVSGIALWWALYWLRAPAVIARADDAGITYADMRRGIFLVFGEAQASWSDVVRVDARAGSRSCSGWRCWRCCWRSCSGAAERARRGRGAAAL